MIGSDQSRQAGHRNNISCGLQCRSGVEGVALGTSLGESWCGDEKGKGHGEREVQGAGPRVIFCIK